MRVALYARVSTKDKRQDTDNQLVQMREYLTRQGWTLKAEYIDHASGAKSDREAFLKMLSAASRREFDLVMFWSLDRFTREGVLRTLNYLQQLDSCGVGYKSFTEQYLDSCGMFKDAVVSILATIAKQERIRISERTKAGLERARRAGKRLGRRQAFSRVELAALSGKMNVSELARHFGVSRQAILKAKAKCGAQIHHAA